jgi:hypothetical protein
MRATLRLQTSQPHEAARPAGIEAGAGVGPGVEAETAAAETRKMWVAKTTPLLLRPILKATTEECYLLFMGNILMMRVCRYLGDDQTDSNVFLSFMEGMACWHSLFMQMV